MCQIEARIRPDSADPIDSNAWILDSQSSVASLSRNRGRCQYRSGIRLTAPGEHGSQVALPTAAVQHQAADNFPPWQHGSGTCTHWRPRSDGHRSSAGSDPCRYDFKRRATGNAAHALISAVATTASCMHARTHGERRRKVLGHASISRRHVLCRTWSWPAHRAPTRHAHTRCAA